MEQPDRSTLRDADPRPAIQQQVRHQATRLQAAPVALRSSASIGAVERGELGEAADRFRNPPLAYRRPGWCGRSAPALDAPDL
jgi:hypothetical protein